MRNRPPSPKSGRGKSGASGAGASRTGGRTSNRSGEEAPRPPRGGGKPGATKTSRGPLRGPARGPVREDDARPARGPRREQEGDQRSSARPARGGDARREDRRHDDRREDRRHEDRRDERRPARAPQDRERAGTERRRPLSAAEELGLESTPLRASTGPALNKHNLLYGVHAVSAAWTNPRRRVRDLFVTESGLEALDAAFDAASTAELDRPEPRLVEKEEIDRLLPPGAVHQGVALSCAPLAEVEIEDIVDAAADDPTALVVVLDQVTDPHNVGAVLRSAAAFGAKAVIVQDRHAPPVTGTLAKTASGAVEAVPLVRVTNLARALDQLKAASFWTVALAESGARHLHEVDLSGRTALVLGSEGDGIRRLTGERCDEIVKLPTGGPVGSLNVSTAAAVALYEVARRR
ncbi:23S rRNA (guanosine(2251)-2'-O)-methyltransferase RlmB [Niveispirillum fermenti]|uniref:23S rRNA (guanosine(2251)-2'-O)-methyltransferase RlmB n=1 Tax=Niveispirillum fermenti TaxID=1233113 RepID=UPI003A89CBA2